LKKAKALDRGRYNFGRDNGQHSYFITANQALHRIEYNMAALARGNLILKFHRQKLNQRQLIPSEVLLRNAVDNQPFGTAPVIIRPDLWGSYYVI